jgi:hypothetical protein
MRWQVTQPVQATRRCASAHDDFLGGIRHWYAFERKTLTDKDKLRQIAEIERDSRNIATAIN